MLRRQEVADELTALKMLGILESESAEVLIQLHLTREIIAAALAEQQWDHPAQVMLSSILGEQDLRMPYMVYSSPLNVRAKCTERHAAKRTPLPTCPNARP